MTYRLTDAEQYLVETTGTDPADLVAEARERGITLEEMAEESIAGLITEAGFTFDDRAAAVDTLLSVLDKEAANVDDPKHEHRVIIKIDPDGEHTFTGAPWGEDQWGEDGDEPNTYVLHLGDAVGLTARQEQYLDFHDAVVEYRIV